MELAQYYKRKKRVSASKKIAFYILSVSLFLLAIWSFFWIPYFRISHITTVGIESASDVQEAVLRHLSFVNRFFIPNDHYAFLSAEKIESMLKEQGFGLANVEKEFPNTLMIKFEKTEPWLMTCKTLQECYYIDENGAISARAPAFSELPLPQVLLKDSASVKLSDNVISADDVLFLKKWFENLKTIDIYPKEIEILHNEEVKILIKDGWLIYLAKNSDPQKLFYDLQLLLDQKIKDSRRKLEYIDLRFENKAFYKLR